jgi:ubiquinone/menaquinone biosynthesis C-methylase UbiE
LTLTRKRFAVARSAHPDFKFEVLDGRRILFDDDVFDLVVSWTVLQHVRPDLLEDVLAEILRVLGPNGRLLLCEETRSPGDPTRTHDSAEPSFYEERFTPAAHALGLHEGNRPHPELASPGRVMLFEH